MDKFVLKALLTCPLFEGFSEEEIETRLSGVNYKLVRFNKKDLYAIEGQPNPYADIVVSGEMSARMESSSGKCVKIASHTMGKLLAPAFIFSKQKAMPVTIEANKPTTIFRMSPATLQMLMNSDQRIQINFVKLLSTTATFLALKVRMLTLHTVREKVAMYLLEEAKRHNSDTITLAVSRQEIADTFAIQKYSLQRCLTEFAKAGFILLEGKNITLIHKEELKSIACF